MNFTKSEDTINLLGDMVINGTSIATIGSFAVNAKWLTLQSFDFWKEDIFGHNMSKVELNGILRSPVFINGVIIFQDPSNLTTCDMELRRGPGTFSLCYYIPFNPSVKTVWKKNYIFSYQLNSHLPTPDIALHRRNGTTNITSLHQTLKKNTSCDSVEIPH